ncbi:MAG: hypothetical protein R2941_05155 [Desulfobacterales bacterium]
MIYFYSSETNINNFKSLKMEFDTWLSGRGPYEFQPFSDRQTFEKHIRGKRNCLVLLSSWHYSIIGKEYGLVPLLTGVRSGKKYQKRILVAASESGGPDILQKGPVASAGSQDYTRSELLGMFGEKTAVDSARILTVPKDIDALMSVGFEMSKSALITESTLHNLKNTDPVLYKKMKTVGAGRESLLLILAAPRSFADGARNLVQLIQEMPKHSGGADIVKMLDLDGWQPHDPSDNSKLEG